MASVDPTIRVAFVQPPRILKVTIEPSASCACGERVARPRACLGRSTGILKIKDTNLGVSCAGDDGAVARVGHEFDGEDIRMVTRVNAGVERK